MTDLFSMDLAELAENMARLLGAYLLAIPAALDRERRSRSAGLRTFPLVSVAACGYVLVGASQFSNEVNARIVQGLITGVGFIGGGAIVRSSGSVEGTATASGIWCTGAIGAAVALQRTEVAIALSLIVFVTFRWVTRLKPVVRSGEPPPEERAETE